MGALSAEVSENYLKHIYHLSLDSSPVKTSKLAAALKLSPAAVTEMVKRLDEQKLVDYRPYRGVSLTEKGRQRALIVLRRHRLWEVFLHQVLKMPWGKVHQHAEALEHATDDELADYLDEYLGGPAFDPHGHPIPGADGSVDEVDRTRLTAVGVGSRVEIVQCANENQALLEYLKGLSLVPGSVVTVREQAPFNGPLSLEIDGEAVVVGAEAARTLLVKALD